MVNFFMVNERRDRRRSIPDDCLVLNYECGLRFIVQNHAIVWDRKNHSTVLSRMKEVGVRLEEQQLSDV